MWEALDGCRLKIEATTRHMQRLQEAINGFFEENLEVAPIVGEANANGTQYLFRVKSVIDYPARKWGVILGDAVHNLRSALDQLVWTFARDGNDRTAFPICLTERDWIVDAPARYWSCPPGFVRMLNDVQPYHRGDVNEARKHPLWILNALSNLDKHRTIPAIALVADSGEAEIVETSGILKMPSIHFLSGVPYEKDRVVAKARIKADPSSSDPYIDAKLKMTFDVGFGKIPAAPSINFKSVEWEMYAVIEYAVAFLDNIADVWNKAVTKAERELGQAEGAT